MALNDSQVYCIGLCLYQFITLGVLSLCNLCPLYSQQILLFLKIYIPLVSLGVVVINHFVCPRQRLNQVSFYCRSIVVLLFGVIVYHVIAVLLGASFLENIYETLLFSCLLTSFTVLPICLVHNGVWEDFIISLSHHEVGSRNLLADDINIMCCFTITGAWLGAFPIPLDWDRDWQNWPITCCIGTISGNFTGCLYVIFSYTSLFDSVMKRKKKI